MPGRQEAPAGRAKYCSNRTRRTVAGSPAACQAARTPAGRAKYCSNRTRRTVVGSPAACQAARTPAGRAKYCSNRTRRTVVGSRAACQAARTPAGRVKYCSNRTRRDGRRITRCLPGRAIGSNSGSGAMDRLGAGSGNGPNVTPQPTTGSDGPGSVAGKNRPGSGSGTTAPANNPPAPTAKPSPSGAPSSAPIDYGGMAPRTPTKNSMKCGNVCPRPLRFGVMPFEPEHNNLMQHPNFSSLDRWRGQCSDLQLFQRAQVPVNPSFKPRPVVPQVCGVTK